MTLWLVLSAWLNLVLAGAVGFTLWRNRKFSRPYDPRVSVYAQKGGKHGWVTAFDQTPNDHTLLSDRPIDAAVARLSDVRAFANGLVGCRFYVKVVRVVHHEHWMEGLHAGK